MKLFQIQMEHAARPSVLYDLRGTHHPLPPSIPSFLSRIFFYVSLAPAWRLFSVTM